VRRGCSSRLRVVALMNLISNVFEMIVDGGQGRAGRRGRGVGEIVSRSRRRWGSWSDKCSIADDGRTVKSKDEAAEMDRSSEGRKERIRGWRSDSPIPLKPRVDEEKSSQDMERMRDMGEWKIESVISRKAKCSAVYAAVGGSSRRRPFCGILFCGEDIEEVKYEDTDGVRREHPNFSSNDWRI
jgi:hypothetical protein